MNFYLRCLFINFKRLLKTLKMRDIWSFFLTISLRIPNRCISVCSISLFCLSNQANRISQLIFWFLLGESIWSKLIFFVYIFGRVFLNVSRRWKYSLFFFKLGEVLTNTNRLNINWSFGLWNWVYINIFH